MSLPQARVLNTCSPDALGCYENLVVGGEGGAELEREVTGTQSLKTAPALVLPGSVS